MSKVINFPSQNNNNELNKIVVDFSTIGISVIKVSLSLMKNKKPSMLDMMCVYNLLFDEATKRRFTELNLNDEEFENSLYTLMKVVFNGEGIDKNILNKFEKDQY